MERHEPLTERQVDRLNRTFRLDRYELLRIRDFPVLHRMLANLFHATYESTLVGKSAKHGFMGPELVKPEFHGEKFDHPFWEEKIGSYRIASAYTCDCGSTIRVKPETEGDIFLPDSFYQSAVFGSFVVEISSRGSIKRLEMIFEKERPGFLRDLIRAFPRGNGKSDRVWLYHLNRSGTAADNVFTRKINFNRVISINVP